MVKEAKRGGPAQSGQIIYEGSFQFIYDCIFNLQFS